MLGQMLNSNLIAFKFAQQLIRPLASCNHTLSTCGCTFQMFTEHLGAHLRVCSLGSCKGPRKLLAGANWDQTHLQPYQCIFKYF